MAKSSQSSFRRILVTRILLVFVPVLLLGEMVALNKARSSLLNTAQQNLTESAVNKGEKIIDDIAGLRSNLITASQTKVIQSGSSVEIQQFLKQLKKQLPTQIDCLQVTRIKKGEIIASSCGNQEITPSDLSPDIDTVDIRFVKKIGEESKLRVSFLLPSDHTLDETHCAILV
ncbi:MAG: hypothetical protein ACK51W_05950, partial [Aphanizomenon sp.]